MANSGAPEREAGSEVNATPLVGRLVKLGSLCIVVAIAVVALVVYLTPLEDPAALPGPTQPLDGPSIPLPTVQLPRAAAELSNEQLQTELLREIDALQTRFPNLPAALHVAAMTYAGLRQTKQAEELWQTCIQLDPKHVGPRLGLATLLTERGDDQAAIEVLKAALSDDCASPEVFYRLATAQTRLGNVKDAETTLITAVESFPDVSENWLLLGQTKNQLQQFKEAEDCLRKAIELGNETSTVYFALANACQRQGKEEQAAKFRQRFSELKAKDPSASRERTFQEIYQQALVPMVVSNLASAAAVYARQGEIEDAERLYLRALEIVPENPQALEELTSLYRHGGRIADANLAQARLVELAPDSVIYRLNQANLLAQLGDLQSAAQTLEKARSLRPDLALPYIALAQVHSQLGDLQQARLFAEAAVRREPSVQGYGLLATICQALGDDEAAAKARELAKGLAGSDTRLELPLTP
jgi:predicted Zn-dependent protease